MSRDINTLYDHLFDALEGVKGGELDLARAKVISDLAQQITNVAKVEIDFMRVTEQSHGTGFIKAPQPIRALPEDRVRAIKANDPWNAKKIG